MQKRKYPPIKVLFPPENFNCLMTLLEKFSVMETYLEAELEFYKIMAADIIEKIEKYSKIVNEKENPQVQICFFENEASFIIEIAILQNSLYLESTVDYFKRISELNSQRLANGKQ